MAGGKWHLVDLENTRHSYNFRVAGESETYYGIERLHDGEIVQKLELLKLAPHIKLFIGLMSTPGAGKSSVAKLLEQKGAYVATSHGKVSSALEAMGCDEFNERDALQGLGSYMGANYPTTWVNMLIEEFNVQQKEVVVWDGVRFPHDVVLPRIAAGGIYAANETGHYLDVKSKGRFESVLVDADERIRAERSRKRGRPGDPKGLADFYRQDFNDRRVFMFDVTRGMAEHTIQNNGTDEELAGKFNELWRDLRRSHNSI